MNAISRVLEIGFGGCLCVFPRSLEITFKALLHSSLSHKNEA